MAKQQCSARVSDPPWYLRDRQCSRRAVTNIAGYPLCKQHGDKARSHRFVSVQVGRSKAKVRVPVK